MRFVVSCFLFGIANSLLAQLHLIPIRNEQVSNNARNSAIHEGAADTIQLPFWDDFSSGQLDTTLWLYGEDVFINNTQGINPPTSFVATFDGINGLGRPYSEGSEYNGPGDSLVSKAIDLSLVPIDKRNTVFLSFFWQLKGYGEIPNEGDSLRLQFFSSDSTWITQDINSSSDHLSLNGGLVNLIFDQDSVLKFQQVILPIAEKDYFHKGFKFRFQSFGSLSGVYDSWHIDYIYLNSDRNTNDTRHFDRAISGISTSLFYPYNSVPAAQFLADPNSYLGAETVIMSNLDNTFHPARFSYQIHNLVTGLSGTQSFMVPADMQPLEIGRHVIIDSYDLPTISGDSIILESEIIYITGDKRLFEEVDPVSGDTLFLSPNLAVNDTLRNRYTIHNYLAYDDGSAEFAAGIPLKQGQIAVAFHVSTPDTLTDIQINFPSIFPSSVGQSIELRVWSDLDNLAILRQFGGTIEANGRNEFQTFTLNTPVIVRDTFYLGFVQETDNYVGIGFDKNNLGGMNSIYTNTSFSWVQNTIQQGSLMIRPVFRNAGDFILGANEPVDLSFYPNPANDLVTFKNKMDQVNLINLNGETILRKTDCEELNLDKLKPGLYVLILQKENQKVSQQLIKQ